MFFKKKDRNETLSNGQSQIENNPYLNAKQEWFERYGTYIKSASNWRLISFLCMVIAIMSIACNIIQANQVKTIPYIVEVDKLGKTTIVNRADQASASPLRLIQANIASCISDWRTVTADVQLQQHMIQRLSYFFGGSAKGVLKEWYAANNPYEIAKGGNLVHVEITSLPLQISQETYRVEWEERTITHSGALVNKQKYQASVTIKIQPPTSESVLLHNPGGVYITELSSSKVFASEPSPQKEQEKLQ